jgi:hypothetical protein
MPGQTFLAWAAAKASRVMHLRLGETSGTAAADQEATNAGVYTGGFTLNQASSLSGDSNPSTLLNGTTGYIAVADSASLDTGDTLSVLLRIKRTRTSHSTYEVIRSKDSGSLVLLTDDGTLGGAANAIAVAKHSAGIITNSTATFGDTNWHTLLVTKTGATVKVYMDGVDRTGTVSNLTITNTAGPLHLGTESSSPAQYLGAYVDEWVEFSTALSATDAVDSHNLAVNGPLTVGTLSLGTTGSTTQDLSWTAAAGGSPGAGYSYRVWQAPDVAGVAGTYAAVGSATTGLTATATGLTAATKYWWTVVVTDSAGTPQTDTSNAVTATTSGGGDVTAPVLTLGAVTAIDTTTATVNATTDESAELWVEWGTATGNYSAGPGSWNGTFATTHTWPLTGLPPDTTIYWRARARDATPNTSSYSGEQTFATLPDDPALVTDGPDLLPRALSDDIARAEWTTDKATRGQIIYGTIPPASPGAYANATALDDEGFSHSIAFPLEAGTTTYWAAVSITPTDLETVTPGSPDVVRSPATRTLPVYTGEVAWSAQRTGAITVGTSTIGGSDDIGGLFSHYTWEPITPVIKDCSITRGRTGGDGAMGAGAMTLVLNDLDGDYNPENPLSPLADNVVPLRPIRLTATHDGDDYGLFFGWITRIEHNPSPTGRETRLECVDFFWWLDACKPVLSLGETTVGAALSALLSACGLSDPAYIALDTGHPIPFLVADGKKSALSIVQELLQVDMGVLFVDGAGVVTYHDAARRYAPAAVDDTLSGSMIGDARPATDVRSVRNGFAVTRLNAAGQPAGETQTAYDAASRDASRYGPRDGDAVQSPYLMSDTQASSLAALKVLLYKDPVNPVRRVRLSNRDDALIARQLARDLGDRMALTESRGGTSTTGFVEAVGHHIWEAGRFHEVSLVITKRRLDVATVGSAIIGDAVIGY